MSDEREREDPAPRDVDAGSEETAAPLLPAADPEFADAEDQTDDGGSDADSTS